MTPLGRYSLYCDHGIHVGSECVRCWQRRALDAEAALTACAEALQSAKAQWGDYYLWGKLIDDECLTLPVVRKLLGEGGGGAT